MFPLLSFTAPVVSAVFPVDASVATRSGESCIGNAKLKGCELRRSAPKISALFMMPVMLNFPYATVCPGATVPSWQLRHRLLDPASGGCGLGCAVNVVLPYIV